MATFNGSTLANNGSFRPGADHTTPPIGSPSVGDITSPTGSAGTNGVETGLIQGPGFQPLTGNETIFRDGDVLDDAKGDWTNKLDGNEDAPITRNDTLLVKGDVSETNHGTTKHTFTGMMAVFPRSEKKAEEPLERLHHVNEVFSYTGFHSDNLFIHVLMGVLGLTGFGTNEDLVGVNSTFAGLIGELHGKELWMKEEEADVILSNPVDYGHRDICHGGSARSRSRDDA